MVTKNNETTKIKTKCGKIRQKIARVFVVVIFIYLFIVFLFIYLFLLLFQFVCVMFLDYLALTAHNPQYLFEKSVRCARNRWREDNFKNLPRTCCNLK